MMHSCDGGCRCAVCRTGQVPPWRFDLRGRGLEHYCQVCLCRVTAAGEQLLAESGAAQLELFQ